MFKYLDLTGLGRVWEKIKSEVSSAKNPDNFSKAVPVSKGGTGATTAAGARTNLGITPANIGAAPTSHTHAAVDITDFATEVAKVKVKTASTAEVASSVDWANVSGRPTAVSAFTNDSNYLVASDIVNKADKASITAGTAGTSSATSGSTLAVPYVKVNAQGIVTGYGTHTHTITGFNNYTHPNHTAHTTSALYKLTVDDLGHVSAATPAVKKDITDLGIPGENSVYTHPDTHPASMITGLATVATSGSYNDLSGKPTIPTTLPAKGGTSDYALKLQTYKVGSTTETYGTNYPIFAQWSDSSNVAMKCTGYTVWSDKATYATSAGGVAWANVSGRPTKVSSFTNDSNYLVASDIAGKANLSGATFTGAITVPKIITTTGLEIY